MKLKAPFPWFGGKSRVAHLVWNALGDADNFIEPFCGSAATLLLRPHTPRIETVNDADCYVANFWRSTALAPEAVAEQADWPVNEADLHARHRWLVLSEEAKTFRQRMRTEPDYFDAKVAGWWCWGLCCWIGGGWCSIQHCESTQYPMLTGNHGYGGRGVNMDQDKGGGPSLDNRKPRIDGGEGQSGHGVHAKGERPHEWQQVPVLTDAAGGRGCNSGLTGGGPGLPQTRPFVTGGYHQYGVGVNAGRPQLADAFSRGRGVNGNDTAGTCDARRAWLVDWFNRLRDRLRTVRVCCGNWLRVCDSESVTTRLGTTGIFFDPPYGASAGRDMNLYAVDSGDVAAEVLAYCLERGSNPKMRIVLAGYAGEGHEVLEANGWQVIAWKSQGGYGNRSAKGKANAKKERLWLSPHCVSDGEPLFNATPASAAAELFPGEGE